MALKDFRAASVGEMLKQVPDENLPGVWNPFPYVGTIYDSS